MELFDELLLSWITILFALLIAKIASAAADLRRNPSRNGYRSVELEDLGRRRERPEQVESAGGICGQVLGSGGAEKDGEILAGRSNEARANEFDLGIEEDTVEKRSQVDGAIEEVVEELDDCLEIGKAGEESVKFDLEDEENREKKISECVDLEIGESVKELDETDRIKFDLQVEEQGEDKRSQVVDLVIEESVHKLDEPVKIGEDDGGMVQDREELSEMRASIREEGCKGDSGSGEKSSIDEREGSLLYGEDEWEGIEKSELLKLFEVATEYVASESGGNALSKLSSDVQKRLYGLHKIATEGPCYEPQSLALKVMARAKWHYWQRLGKMNPEVAMEQYIALLSDSIPGWMGEHREDAKQDKGDDTLDKGASRTEAPVLSSFLDGQPTSSGTQRVFEDPYIEDDKPTSGPKLLEKGLTKTFLFSLLSPPGVTLLTFYW